MCIRDSHVSERVLAKGWESGLGFIWGFSWEKLQWEPISEKLRNSQSIASKGGLISLESSIAAEAKIATLMQRIEALETKELANVNQINPPPIHNLGFSYCQAPNHVFKECSIFQTHQVPPEHMNVAYLRPPHNPYSQTYNPVWRNHPNFSWAQNNSPRPNVLNNLHHPTHPTKFPSEAPSSSFQSSPIEKKFSKLEESMEAFMKSQTAFMQNQEQTLSNHSQGISRLKMQWVN